MTLTGERRKLHENKIPFLLTRSKDVAEGFKMNLYDSDEGKNGAVMIRPTLQDNFDEVHFDGDIRNTDALDIFALKNQFARILFYSEDVIKKELFKYSHLNVFVFVEPGYKHLGLVIESINEVLNNFKPVDRSQTKPHFIITYRMNYHRKLLFKFNVDLFEEIKAPIFAIAKRNPDDDSHDKWSRAITVDDTVDSTEIANNQIIPFLEECLSGKCEKVLSSLPVPTKQQQDSSQVFIVVGKTFESLVLEGSKSKNILVAFYSPTCRGSKWMMPHFEEASSKFEESSEIVFAKLDVISNEVPHKSADCPTLPMIKLFKKGENTETPNLFIGEPNYDNLVSFLVKELAIDPDDEL